MNSHHETQERQGIVISHARLHHPLDGIYRIDRKIGIVSWGISTGIGLPRGRHTAIEWRTKVGIVCFQRLCTVAKVIGDDALFCVRVGGWGVCRVQTVTRWRLVPCRQKCSACQARCYNDQQVRFNFVRMSAEFLVQYSSLAELW